MNYVMVTIPMKTMNEVKSFIKDKKVKHGPFAKIHVSNGHIYQIPVVDEGIATYLKLRYGGKENGIG